MESAIDLDLPAMTGDLQLDGHPLEAPRLVPAGPGDGDAAVLAPTAFLRTKDPRVQQEKTWAEDVQLPRDASVLLAGARLGTSLARVVHEVLEPSECAALLARANEHGFTPLSNRFRRMLDCPELAAYLLEVLRPHLPARLCHGKECLEELNPRFRFTCYLPGQEFGPHCDPYYAHPKGHPKEGQVSRITVLLYLHDVPEANGGATNFVGRSLVACQPRGGSALIFTQDLRHEGSRVNAGLKYFIRSELMYGEDREARALQDLIDSI
mmetsp:Transcript_36477/g.73553  ORF Transcript_36477/g.73553 Transcript_36477/m.73553 type:complete len:267 (+) Transcript_36477:65-865(+)|eukprot:CAMPEP_0113830172 /NCGR_PEP_ID=MMETSP0328-20130328/6191_1 /TAXON_ID=39455 /ORGANISM="Alexandrium minutum" /LENGTH=266 /DNA_ID=CAMNT_0000798275 /DNA_START=49 /DNA_END=849 /DNA_ORIENTATION=- /assembly_acc=CAM_ASM_000350